MADFHNSRIVLNPTKTHRCEQCGKTIAIGQEHHAASGRFDGDFYSYREHLQCRDAWNQLNFEIRDLDAFEGAPFLREDEFLEGDRIWMRQTFPLVAERLGWSAP